MAHPEVDRREFVAALVGGATAAFVKGHWPEIREASLRAAHAPENAPFRVLTPDQVREFDAFSATLIPTDDTPGAREAHVVRFLDTALSTFWKDRVDGFGKAMDEVAAAVGRRVSGERSLVALNETDQIAVLQDLEKNKRQIFFRLRNATMVGMFSHPDHGGNFGKVGWKLIGFDDRHSWVAPFGYYDRA